VSRVHASINPFYALVVIVGVVFVITALAYVAALVVSESSSGGSGVALNSPVLRFVEQRGESLMLWETGALAAAAVLAMGLDRWRARKLSIADSDGEPNRANDPAAHG
jgi:hypothetical protein